MSTPFFWGGELQARGDTEKFPAPHPPRQWEKYPSGDHEPKYAGSHGRRQWLLAEVGFHELSGVTALAGGIQGRGGIDGTGEAGSKGQGGQKHDRTAHGNLQGGDNGYSVAPTAELWKGAERAFRRLNARFG
jgi:hypothetical protein